MDTTNTQVALAVLVFVARLEGFEESFERSPDGSYSLRLRRPVAIETDGVQLPEAA